ncbi:SgcJ/EcaC family oxidoreductase [Actinophytocola sp. KF-1]
MTTNEVPVADQAAVATLPQQLLTAWVDEDANAIAELFTDDGTLILPGVFRKGREDIRLYFKEAFDNQYRGTRVVGTPLGLRFFGPDAALLLSSGGVLAAGETEVSDGQAIRASWFAVRVDGQWKLASYQNTPATRGLPVPGTDA